MLARKHLDTFKRRTWRLQSTKAITKHMGMPKKSKFHSKTKTIYRVNFDEKLDEENETMHQPPHHAYEYIPEDEATLEMEDEILPGFPERKFSNLENE